jgi:hypothetical protein
VPLKRRGALLLTIAAALAFAGQAGADGDPASDVLFGQSVFVPYPPPGNEAVSALKRAVAAVYSHRFRIKVAVIASPPDLGAVPELYNKPQQYAKFLGAEIRSFYVGPLLIAMPAGFGVYDGGRSTAAEDRVLATISMNAGNVDELTRSAASAVQALRTAGALRSKDILRPLAIPLPAKVRRGEAAQLRFGVSDDSGFARLIVSVTRGTRTVARLATGLRAVKPQGLQTVTWHVPRGLAARPLHSCVVARDLAGNRSRRSCASVTVR